MLLFRHIRVPSAGLQVPGGTLEPGETPSAGALREAREETGITNLGPPHLLGVRLWQPPDSDVLRRHIYHMPLLGELSLM